MKGHFFAVVLLLASCKEPRSSVDYSRQDLVLGGEMGFGATALFVGNSHHAGQPARRSQSEGEEGRVYGRTPWGQRSTQWRGRYIYSDTLRMGMRYHPDTGRVEGFMPWGMAEFRITDEQGTDFFTGRTEDGGRVSVHFNAGQWALLGRFGGRYESLQLGQRYAGFDSPLRSMEVIAAVLLLLTQKTSL